MSLRSSQPAVPLPHELAMLRSTNLVHGLPQVLGEGHETMTAILVDEPATLPLLMMLVLGVVKTLATSVTTVPATAIGLGDRIGDLAVGYDADVAVWERHPFRIGARPTPQSTYLLTAITSMGGQESHALI